MSRLGLSYEQFLDITPRELDDALQDHEKYWFIHTKQQMILQRYIGVTLRNKGLKKGDQTRDPRKFFKFWWEQAKKVHVPTRDEWKMLDKKYIRK